MQHIQKQDITRKERKVLFTNKIEVRPTNNQHILKESYQAFCQVSMPLIAICKNKFMKVCTT